MKKRFFLPAMVLAAAFASCNSDDVANQESRAALGVNVSVNELGSRAMVSGEYLANGDQIGISVVANADGGNYDGNTTGYINVAYRASGETTSQTWAAADAQKQILLSGTAGKAVAYFPYLETVTDFEAIPVDITEQKDWMWSGFEGPLTDAAPNVAFEMNHAQTAVNIKVVRDASYTGAGAVSTLSVTSEGLATKGNFSAVNGEFYAASLEGTNTEVSIIAGAFTLVADDAGTADIKENEKENPYMFIPASDETKNFTVKATIDGKAYTVGVNMAEAFNPGKVYLVSVKISNIGLIVDSVVVLNDWIPSQLPEGELKPAA